MVITTSGRCRRIAAAMSRRSGTPYSTSPSAWPRKSTSDTPTTAALRRSSSWRSGPTTSGAMPSMPASPAVANT